MLEFSYCIIVINILAKNTSFVNYDKKFIYIFPKLLRVIEFFDKSNENIFYDQI